MNGFMQSKKMDEIKQWCKENFIRFQYCMEANKIAIQLLDALKGISVENLNLDFKDFFSELDDEEIIVLKLITLIFGGKHKQIASKVKGLFA